MRNIERRVRMLSLAAVWSLLAFVVWFIPNSGLIRNNNGFVDQVTEAARRVNITEGVITDAAGEVLSGPEEDGEVRCADPESFGFLIGYREYEESDGTYRGTGLRYRLSNWLLTDDGDRRGCTVRLTLDAGLQRAATALLRDRGCTGSILVMENRTGALRCFASADQVIFDVNDLSSVIDDINEIPDFWLRKGDSETDPPGSVGKLLTAACAFRNGKGNFTYVDDGELEAGDTVIRNWGWAEYGKLDMAEAFSKSVNTYFGALALELGKEAMTETAEGFLLGEEIPLDFTTLTSSYRIDSDFDLAETGFGQGKVEITPLHLLMIGSTVPNGGRMKKPYLIEEVLAGERRRYAAQEEILIRSMKESEARKVASLMEGAAEYYGLKAADRKVGAKTGTAECAVGNHTYLLCWTEDHTVLVSRNFSPSGAVGSDLIPLAQSVLDRLYGTEE